MKRILALLIAVMLLAAVIPATSLAVEAANDCGTTYKVYRVHTSGSRLMLRSGPGTGYRIVARLCNGKPLKYIKRSGNWYKVKTFNGYTGWVSRHYVNCGAYADVATHTSGLNYRTGPGTGYRVKGSFAKGTCHLLVSKVNGNWAYVSKHGKCGWSSMNYLEWEY